MDYKEASQIYGIPVQAFKRMRKKGLIDETIKPSDKPYLMFLCRIWGDNEFLWMQLSKKTKKMRLRLIEPRELNRLERHILTRFTNHYKKNDGEWLYVDTVGKEVSSIFKIPINRNLIETVEKMKRKARYDVKEAVGVSKSNGL